MIEYWLCNERKWRTMFKSYLKLKSGITWKEAEEYSKLMSVKEWNGIHPHKAVNEEMSYW